MKRVADKQLIKDGRDEEEDDDVGTGFRKADESTLARRQIRGLPKRSLAGGGAVAAAAPASSPAGFSWGAPTSSVPAPMVSEDATPVSKFAGFSGFGGSSAGTSSPFTFSGSGTNTTSATTTSATSFGSTFGSTAPTTTAAASNATKTFASFLSGSSATNGLDSKPTPTPASTTPLPTLSAPASNSEEDKRALTYYTSLRGLNVSLANAINKYIDQDPFADVTALLEQYKSKRADIQKDFDSKKQGAAHMNGASTAPAKSTLPSASGSSFAPPPISASSSMESKSPSLGTGFAFTPKPTPLSAESSFTLPPSIESKSSDSKPAASGFSFGGSSGASTTAPSTSGGFSFGASAKDTSSSSAPSSGGFSFGAPSKDSKLSSAPSSSGFSFAAPAKDSGPSSTPPSSGFSFAAPAKDSGPSSLSSSSGFSFRGSTKDTGSSSSGFSFGAPSNPSASASSSLPFALTSTSSSSAPKSFSFGAEKPKDESMDQEDAKPAPSSSGLFGLASNSSSTSPFGTFGKPAGGSGFSFGSSSTFGGSSSTPSAFGGASAGSGFSFSGGSGSTTVTKKEDGTDGEAQEGTGGNTAADVAPTAASMLGVNPHDEEGEGEEDEETVHAIKSKAFRMKKADEKGGPGWVEIGYGVLRLKKHKGTSARRMLLRNSTTGKININFALYSGLKPSQAKKAVTFIGHDNGVAQTYSVRVPNEEAAKELKEVLEREIAFVKAKESD